MCYQAQTRKLIPYLFAFVGLLSLGACQHSLPSYLVTQGLQQGAIYLHAEDIKTLLSGNELTDKERRYLLISQSVLEYAQNELQMNPKGAYQKYTRLDRDAVTWVVVAAPRDAVKPHFFSYPIMGDLPYRGYFKKSSAEEYAQYLEKKEDLDVYVRPVPAYSSTGWLPDPVLSTMFSSELDFIETLIHEMVHLQFYLAGEAMFNEAFATWYAEKATLQYINHNPSRLLNANEAAQDYAELLKKSEQHRLINTQVRLLAQNAYSDSSKNLKEKRADFFEKVRQLYRDAGFEKSASGTWNNARIASLSTYFKMIPYIESHYQKSRLRLNDYLNRVTQAPSETLAQVKKLDESF